MKTASQLVATGVRRSDLKIRDAHHPRDHTRIWHQKEGAAEKLRLRNRRFMLAVLFVVRLIMSFQFQSVAGVAPCSADFGVGLANIGILIGGLAASPRAGRRTAVPTFPFAATLKTASRVICAGFAETLLTPH
jgi:hypothetical protein